MWKEWVLLSILAVLTAGVAAGCGEGDQMPNSGGIGPNSPHGNDSRISNDGGADSGPTDAQDGTDIGVGEPEDAGERHADVDGGDGDSGSDARPCADAACEDAESCPNGECAGTTPQSKCDGAENLGVLSEGHPINISDTTMGATDVLQTPCSAGGDELVYRFSVVEDSMVHVESSWPEQFDAKVEFRIDDCMDDSSGGVCLDGDESFPATAGSEIYMVVEQDVGRGNDFELELSATADSCLPGTEFCGQDALQICRGNDERDTYRCADACADAKNCAGTRCANAISVTGSMTYEGDLSAYENAMDFQDNEFCQSQSQALSTPGPEVTFRLDELSAGQTVSISTGPNRAMFITASCAAPILCTDVLVSSGSEGFVEWEVPAGADDQTYYVIIDKRTDTVDDFSYSFDIRD